MTPQKKAEWKPESFPEPHTIPSGWDTTSFATPQVKGWQETSLAISEKEETATDWVPEKFPKPHTYPNNWSIDD